MAVNIRLGKEEEEALHRKGNGDNTTTTATVEVGVEGEKERRGRSLFNGPSHSKLVSFIVTILTLHLFHYLYCLGAAHPLLILEAFLTSFLFFSSSIRARPKPSSPINLALNFASE